MKKVLIVLVILAVAVVAGVALLLGNLGSLIKDATEKFGSDATQSKVTLSSADVSLSSGEGSLKKLVVGNPEGFSTPSAFELGEISVKLDTSTITSSTVVIKEVVIQGPKVTYELSSSFASNLAKIQSNVDGYTRRVRGGGGGKGAATPADEGGGRKFVIETLRIQGGRVELSASLAQGAAVGANIPGVELHDIGKSEGGATPQQIAAKVLEVITTSAIDAVAKAGLEKSAKDLLSGTLGTATDALTDLLGGKDEEADPPKGKGKGKPKPK